MADFEIWQPIPGHNGYEASNLGRVRSLDRIITRTYHNDRTDKTVYLGRILKPKFAEARYPQVVLENQQQFYIHDLILLAFVGPKPPRKICRHRDDDPWNNRLDNLHYGTRRQNHADAVRNGKHTRGERNYNAILTPDAVRKIRASTYSYAVLAAQYGVSKATILNVRNGRSWKWLK